MFPLWWGLLLLGLVSCGPAARPVDPKAAALAPSPRAAPSRVVSLLPSATELIYQVGAGSLLVGVTVHDKFPPEVEKLPRVGDQTIDVERLLTLEPDLIVLDTAFNSNVDRYAKLGLRVLALESRRLADVGKNLRLLGETLGQAEAGRAAAESFEKELQTFPKLDRREKVFVEIWGSPLMTVGADSLPDDLLKQLGLSNVYSDQKGYFQVDPEDVVARRPAIVILPSDDPKATSAAAKLLRGAGLEVQVIVIDGSLFTNPTTRVVEGLRIVLGELAQATTTEGHRSVREKSRNVRGPSRQIWPARV